VLETGSGEDRAEERLSFYIDGEKITGGFDAVVRGDWLADFKYTSVWSAIYKDRLQEWIAQVNMYVYGLEANGTHITRATVEAFFRDWSQTEALRRGDYPQEKWQRFEILIWPRERTEAFMRERIRLLREARALDDSELRECSPRDKWEKPTKWAVTKKGAKRATKLHEREGSAQEHKTQLEKAGKGKYTITKRPGACVRCERYCSAAQVCPFVSGGVE